MDQLFDINLKLGGYKYLNCSDLKDLFDIVYTFWGLKL
jgi:hypothetical protein